MMRVADVMTVAVITGETDMPLVRIARSMIEHGVGAMPIMEGSELVGLVTRSDVLPFESDPDRTLRTAADIMRRDVVAVHEGMTVAEAARVLAARGVKRAPVLRDGRLVGIVSESDLLRPYLRTDREIRAELEETLHAPALGLSNGDVTFGVQDGAVTLSGMVSGEAQRSLIHRMVRSVEGVAAVMDELVLVPANLAPGDLQAVGGRN